MKKKILHKIMQLLANYVVFMLEKSNSKEMFDYYFEFGAKLNAYAIVFHEIYLD